MLTRTDAIVFGVTHFDWAWKTNSRFVLRSLSEPSEEKKDASEPESLLDIIGGFDVGFTATRKVTGGPHPSGLRKDYNLKLLN